MVRGPSSHSSTITVTMWFDLVKNYVGGIRIVTEWLGSGAETVEKEKAQNRTNTCLICPHNKHGVELTESAMSAVREQVGVKNHLNLHTDGENDLFTCELCSCPLKLKVWIPHRRVKLNEGDKDKFPAHCWLKTEEHDRSDTI